jgi:DNA helicase-2/ATP-dependent DNA helicase PcrA
LASHAEVKLLFGRSGMDALGGLFVGTIHAYCFRLLQQYVPRYETYDVLDDNQLAAFLSREATRLEIRELDAKKRLFAALAAFLASVEIVENELLDPDLMPDPFRSILLSYYNALERSRLLTYGQQIVRAVSARRKSILGYDASAPPPRGGRIQMYH